MGTFSKIKKYSKPSLEINEKIKSLDKDIEKTLGEAISNSTSGLYTVTGFEPGDPAIPEIPAVPAVPPTYEDVTGGISNPDDFVWSDQGDGSDPDAAVVIPDNLYTTYNGEQVAALRQVDVDHGNGVVPLGLAFHGRAISSQVIGFITDGGFNGVVQSGVFTTPGPYTDLQQAYLTAWNTRGTSGIFQYSTTKTILLWGQLDCLFGSCYGGSQYFPANLSNTSTPKADRALYSYELVIPTDASGNPLPNRFVTDPGSPEIPAVPGIPEGPPRPIVISRNALGDPNYYPGPIPSHISDKWGLSQEAYNQLISYDPYTGYGETDAEERKRNRELLDFFLGGGAGDPSSPDVQKQIRNLRNALKGV
jgi:hypothetical protein